MTSSSATLLASDEWGSGGSGAGGGKISSVGWQEQLLEVNLFNVSGLMGKFFSFPPSELQSPRYPSSAMEEVDTNGTAPDAWNPLVEGPAVGTG